VNSVPEMSSSSANTAIRNSQISQKKLLKFLVIVCISTVVCLVEIVDLFDVSSFITCGEPLLCAEALMSSDIPDVTSTLDL
jgi:hypothetical protein